MEKALAGPMGDRLEKAFASFTKLGDKIANGPSRAVERAVSGVREKTDEMVDALNASVESCGEQIEDAISKPFDKGVALAQARVNDLLREMETLSTAYEEKMRIDPEFQVFGNTMDKDGSFAKMDKQMDRLYQKLEGALERLRIQEEAAAQKLEAALQKSAEKRAAAEKKAAAEAEKAAQRSVAAAEKAASRRKAIHAAMWKNMLAKAGDLNLTVGTEVTLYKVSEDGTRKKVGLFTLEAPERLSKNTYKITAYDRISWLERDITTALEFISTVNAWPYGLYRLAKSVCGDCLLTLKNASIPNGDFPVNKFQANKMTARDLLGYIAELSGQFVRATPDGEIEFAWYEDSGVVIHSTGERYYNTLKYEDYQVGKIDIVQVQLASGEYGAVWPEGKQGDNAYVISGNPLITVINEDLLPWLETLQQQIAYSIYTPCKATIPACLDIQPGHIVRFIDGNGIIIDTYVMTKIQKGQRETLESTGSARRDSPTIVNKKTPEHYANEAMKRQTQTDIFNKLTNYGTVEGLFLDKDGQIFVNAAFIATGILQSKDGSTFYLDLDKGILEMDAQSISISGESISSAALKNLSQQELVDALTDKGAADGIYLKDGQLYINATYIVSGTLNASVIKAGILQSKDNGETFKLDLDKGTFHMSGTGKFMAPDGRSYMTVDGGSFVLHTKDTNPGYGMIHSIAAWDREFGGKLLHTWPMESALNVHSGVVPVIHNGRLWRGVDAKVEKVKVNQSAVAGAGGF